MLETQGRNPRSATQDGEGKNQRKKSAIARAQLGYHNLGSQLVRNLRAFGGRLENKKKDSKRKRRKLIAERFLVRRRP